MGWGVFRGLGKKKTYTLFEDELPNKGGTAKDY